MSGHPRERPKCLDCKGFDAIHVNPPRGVSWCQCGDPRCACYGWNKGGIGWVSRHVLMSVVASLSAGPHGDHDGT